MGLWAVTRKGEERKGLSASGSNTLRVFDLTDAMRG
jgi:hypothetical protein